MLFGIICLFAGGTILLVQTLLKKYSTRLIWRAALSRLPHRVWFGLILMIAGFILACIH